MERERGGRGRGRAHLVGEEIVVEGLAQSEREKRRTRERDRKREAKGERGRGRAHLVGEGLVIEFEALQLRLQQGHLPPTTRLTKTVSYGGATSE